MNAPAPGASNKRLPFDRYQRYALAARAIALVTDRAPGLRILEIGSNVHRDLERFAIGHHITYLDRTGESGETGAFVRGDGLAVPFGDRSFDIVLALDVLEHVPAAQRTAFLDEMLRVAGLGAIVGAPFHSQAVLAQEADLNAYFRDLHGQSYPWLAEHEAHGLPALDQTVAHVRARGWHAVVQGAGNLALWTKLMRAHFFVNSEPDLLELRGDVDELYNSELALRDYAPPVYRHFIVATRSAAALQALTNPQHLPHSVRPEDLTRLQTRLDRLYADGTRARSRRIRAALADEQAARADVEARYTQALNERDQRIAELAQQTEHHARTTATLTSALGAESKRVADLEARAQAQDASMAALAAQMAHLQQQPAPALSALRQRARAALLLLGRVLPQAMLALTQIWRARVHRMRLDPIYDLTADGDTYRSVGDDPQFALHTTRRHLPSSWVEIAFDTEPQGQWLSPRLYVDGGRGFSEEESFSLPVRGGRRVQCLIGLPYRVYGLRLDPLSAPGRFVLRNVTIREIGLLQLALAVAPQLRTLPLHPREWPRLAGLALTMLRTGGVRSVVSGVLARDREAADYQDWIGAYGTLSDSDRQRIRAHIATFEQQPRISIIMPTYNTPEPWLRRAIESVRAQLYDNWELCVADDGSTAPHVHEILEAYRTQDARIRVTYRRERGHISAASNSAIELATGSHIAMLDHDDELADTALYLVAHELNAAPDAEIIYSDEDKIDVHGRRFAPYFKPDWDPDLALAQNLVTHLCVYRSERIRALGGFRSGYEGAQDWDLVLRVAEAVPPTAIRHIPHVLYHWRAAPGSTAMAIEEKSYASQAQRRTLTSHFERVGQVVDLLPVAGLCWRVRYPLPQPPPLVTVIIPTRDRAALLRRCISSLRHRTTYANLEIVVIDNQSVEPTTLLYLAELAAEPDVTVLRYDAPFNFSAINNLGARHAQGTVLALINNDVESIAPGWLDEMVSQACRPEIGAVGAMLYYPDDRIQHAGVILGHGTSGIAAHAYAHRPRGHIGQIGRAMLVQTMSAVTAACLVLRREVFLEVGGFDETNLTIAYNDLDLCLRIRERGYRNLWTPAAELYHRESASRGYEDTPAKRERFQREIEYIRRRWQEQLRNDPAYNSNLSLDGESFTLAYPPRTTKPWLTTRGSDSVDIVTAA